MRFCPYLFTWGGWDDPNFSHPLLTSPPFSHLVRASEAIPTAAVE